MSNKCAVACPKHQSSFRSRSMPPNRNQEQNGSSVPEGHNPRRSGHCCAKRRRSCQNGSQHVRQDYSVNEVCHYKVSTRQVTTNAFTIKLKSRNKGYSGDSKQQNPPKPNNSPERSIAALTAQAYNSYKQTFKPKEVSAFNLSDEVDPMLGDGVVQGYNKPVPIQKFGSQPQYVNYNQYNQTVSNYPAQKFNQNNPNPIDVVVRVNQGGNPSPASQVVWSSNNQSVSHCNSTKHAIDFWAGEQNQVQINRNLVNQNLNQNQLPAVQQRVFSFKKENQDYEFDNQSCLSSPLELAMQVQPKPRFRAGGGGSLCPKQGRGSQEISLPQSQQTTFSQVTETVPSTVQGLNCFCGGGGSGGPSFGAMPEPEPAYDDFPQAFGGQCLESTQMGVGSNQPEISPVGEAASKQSFSEKHSTSGASSSTKGKSKTTRFEFSSPDTLRTKLQQYIHNRPVGPNPVGKIKPFLGARENALSCRTCYTPDDENTLPAPCQPCGRLEMTAEDFEAEEMAAKKKVDDAKELAEKEKIMAEVACYKSIMPLDLTCNEQIEYMQCLGASGKIINAFKEVQQQEAEQNANMSGSEEGMQQQFNCGSYKSGATDFNQPGGMSSQPPNNSCSDSTGAKQEFLQQLQNAQNTPLPDPNYRKKVLARQVMPPSQRRRVCSKSPAGPPITPIAEENEQCQSVKSSREGPDDLSELLQQCRDELGVANFVGQSADLMQQSGGDCDNMQNIVDEDVRLFKMLSLSQGGQQPQDAFSCPPPPECPSHSGGGDEPKKDEDEDLDDEALLQKYPMFGAPAKSTERSLKETMELYKLHLANIRRRYFGEVVKLIDEVENITPEIAAAMVFSEEEGRSLKSAPQKMYDYLYPQNPSLPLVTIGDVTKDLPPGYDDIVVPLIPPMFLTAMDNPALEDPAMLDSPRVIQIGPALNLADEPMITDTKAPTDVAELVTGLTENQGLEMGEDEEGEEVEFEDVFNVKLQVTMPPHYCRMQMRGSQAPNWFPGYYMALQSKPGVNVNSSHGTILEQVWQDVQPDAVRPGGGAIIIGE